MGGWKEMNGECIKVVNTIINHPKPNPGEDKITCFNRFMDKIRYWTGKRMKYTDEYLLNDLKTKNRFGCACEAEKVAYQHKQQLRQKLDETDLELAAWDSNISLCFKLEMRAP